MPLMRLWHTHTYPSSSTSNDLGFHDHLVANKASNLTFIQNEQVPGFFLICPVITDRVYPYKLTDSGFLWFKVCILPSTADHSVLFSSVAVRGKCDLPDIKDTTYEGGQTLLQDCEGNMLYEGIKVKKNFGYRM